MIIDGSWKVVFLTFHYCHTHTHTHDYTSSSSVGREPPSRLVKIIRTHVCEMRTGRAGGEEEGKKQKTKNGNLYSSRNKDKNVWRFFFVFGKKKNTQSRHELQEWIELAYSLDWSELRNASRQFFFSASFVELLPCFSSSSFWNATISFRAWRKENVLSFSLLFLRVERVKKGRLTRNGPATNVK